MNRVVFYALLIGGILWGCNPRKTDKNLKDGLDPFKEVQLNERQKTLAGQIDRLVKKRHKQGLFNGSILVAEHGLPIYLNALGFSNYKTKDSLTVFTPFQLASVSKMFTATAILLLEQQGLLSTLDTVQSILPVFPYKNLTIHHLLTHRSGLPRYMVISDEFWPRDTMLTNEDMHLLMSYHCPESYFKPNTRFNYQNSNYAYLALIVERVSGQPFDRYVRDHIFEPLGMFDSKVYSGSKYSDIPAAATGHIYRRPRTIYPEENYINGVVGDKGVYSTVLDLLKFDQALYTDTFLTALSKEKAFFPYSKFKNRKRDSYGYGWRIHTDPQHPNVYHYGWWNGFKTCFIRYTKDKYTIIVLTNRDRKLGLPKEIQKLLFEESK